MHITEVGKFFPISGKSQNFQHEKACFQKLVFESFVPGQNC